MRPYTLDRQPSVPAEPTEAVSEGGGAESGPPDRRRNETPPVPPDPQRRAREWIAIDWTVSGLRAWQLGPHGSVLDQVEAPAACPAGETPLGWFSLIQRWLSQDAVSEVLIARCDANVQFLRGAEWLDIPTPAVLTRPISRVPTGDARLRAYCMPGLRSPGGQAYTRSGYVKVAGTMGLRPDFEGTICLPGIRSHWVRIAGGDVVGLTSSPMGQLEALLAGSLVSGLSVPGAGGPLDPREHEFLAAFEETLAHPERASVRLNRIHAESIFGQIDPESAEARLCGILAGLDLAGARSDWQGQSIALVGGDRLVTRYAAAFRLLGHEVTAFRDVEALLQGFLHLRGVLARGD